MSKKDAIYLLMLEIIAPHDGESKLSQEMRDDIYEKFKQHKSWEEVFSSTPKEYAEKMISLFKELEKDG